MHSWRTTTDGLKKEFKFDSMTHLAQFLLKVAELSDLKNHHPNTEIKGIDTLILTLTTHDEGGIITKKDLELSELIDALTY